VNSTFALTCVTVSEETGLIAYVKVSWKTIYIFEVQCSVQNNFSDMSGVCESWTVIKRLNILAILHHFCKRRYFAPNISASNVL